MATDSDSDTLQWSAQFAVAPPTRTNKLPGDKILLPPSALEQLLAAAPITSVESAHTHALTPQFDPFNPHTFAAERRARELFENRQQQLPNPLTFRLVNPSNGRVVHAGIREFSAQENEVGLSSFLRQSLGLDDVAFPSAGEDSSSDVDMLESGKVSDMTKRPLVTIHAKRLPRGSYVRLRPLEAGYDPEDWKALLERHLRENFTTLTLGELLLIPGPRNETFRFLVDKVEPQGDGICIVDTDLEVDIEALNEEQARETLKKRLAKASRAPGVWGGSSIGGKLSQGQETSGQVLPGQYVDYELNDWDHGRAFDVEIDVADGADVDLFISPFSARQRSRPRDNEHVFGDFSSFSPKRICLQPTNVELQDAESLYISVHAYSGDTPDGNDTTSTTTTPLKFNLRTKIIMPGETLAHLEEAEHDANDTQCKNCHQWIPERTLFLHENFCLRNNILCPKCENVFQKRSPEWENHWHCPHDSSYGNDQSSQLKHNKIFHTPHVCPNCPFTATSLPILAHTALHCPQTHLCHSVTSSNDTLGLCTGCFGPLYADVYDPEGKALRRRIERRYMTQMLKGCGKGWCLNPCCKTGRSNSATSTVTSSDNSGEVAPALTSKEISAMIKPFLDAINVGPGRAAAAANTNTSPFYFCTDEKSQQRRKLAELLAAETGTGAELGTGEGMDDKGYDVAWCIAAVEAGAGDVGKAREWLKNWAPAKGEKVIR
ncbi:ubiquitin fusion degradation protein [Histoplasma capsulatum H143]|uniref:Ubiquitin fusion degradation protein n=1 Tax=Ajellomyces capsulatus (strain H143) TaxID=544712 RepID=C6H542_AJECH|nr:ubiquitin fusion degradation protein [Histoplasma capsulatum H143]